VLIGKRVKIFWRNLIFLPHTCAFGTIFHGNSGELKAGKKRQKKAKKEQVLRKKAEKLKKK